jgi:hypothetical protein
MKWRVGTKVPLNVYEGDRAVCQCHTAADARRIVAAMNAPQRVGISTYPEPCESFQQSLCGSWCARCCWTEGAHGLKSSTASPW